MKREPIELGDDADLSELELKLVQPGILPPGYTLRDKAAEYAARHGFDYYHIAEALNCLTDGILSTAIEIQKDPFPVPGTFESYGGLLERTMDAVTSIIPVKPVRMVIINYYVQKA
ncbi:hypothetical protein HYX12_02240 [Candidatus Woesearchaeota archaeon]|nr:hypothetical protein [Candidatus Woesearchaeota archaeon]